jgi:serine protease Do
MMKKIILSAFVLGCMVVSFKATAQERIEKKERTEKPEPPEKPERKESEEIIIRNKGDKEMNLKVEINGDKIIVNGKPLVEFKDDGITINKRKMIIRGGDGDRMMTFDFNGPQGMDELMGLERLKEMNKNEILHKPFLGVTTEKTTDGAKIVDIAKGSAAEKAGLKKDDIITKIDKEEVTDAAVLANIISAKKPKDEIKIYYKREGKKKDTKAVLGERIENRTMELSFKHPNVMVRPFRNPNMQITPMPGGEGTWNMDNFNFGPEGLGDIFPRQKRFGLKIQDTEEGGKVKVIDVEDSSAAQKAGLKKDDIITAINGQKINNTDEAREQLQQAAEKSAYKIKATRNGTEMDFEVKIPKKLKTANL